MKKKIEIGITITNEKITFYKHKNYIKDGKTIKANGELVIDTKVIIILFLVIIGIVGIVFLNKEAIL